MRRASRSNTADVRVAGGAISGGRWRPSLLVGLEVRLASAADRAEPVVGDVLERRAGGDASVRVALGGVVDEAARGAHPALGGGVAHRAGTVAWAFMAEFGRDDLQRTGEEYNLGAPTTPRQAASVILLRGGADSL